MIPMKKDVVLHFRIKNKYLTHTHTRIQEYFLFAYIEIYKKKKT